MLGHGDEMSQPFPKRIDELFGIEITSIKAGGLHTLALSDKGKVYSWGRGEGA